MMFVFPFQYYAEAVENVAQAREFANQASSVKLEGASENGGALW